MSLVYFYGSQTSNQSFNLGTCKIIDLRGSDVSLSTILLHWRKVDIFPHWNSDVGYYYYIKPISTILKWGYWIYVMKLLYFEKTDFLKIFFFNFHFSRLHTEGIKLWIMSISAFWNGILYRYLWYLLIKLNYPYHPQVNWIFKNIYIHFLTRSWSRQVEKLCFFQSNDQRPIIFNV